MSAMKNLANEIRLLEKGERLEKMSSSSKFKKRFFKLDLDKMQLTASTKRCGKLQKEYSFDKINEIIPGCKSTKLADYKTKMKKPQQAIELENLTFVITYNNYKKTLDLKAPNQETKIRWIEVLNNVLNTARQQNKAKDLDWTEDDTLLRHHFSKADSSKDSKINAVEINRFLASMNLKLKKDQIEALIQQADKNKDGSLTEEEFKDFVTLLFRRKEMLSLFYLIASRQKTEPFPDFVTVTQFQHFLNVYQRETKSISDCIQLINEYEPDSILKENQHLSFHGLVNYMNDEKQSILMKEKTTQVYQRMDLPIFSYFVNSSHNTYLSGDQLASKSSANSYRAAIMAGARLVEMDVYDGPDNQPEIFHQKTLTSKMFFKDALIIIKEYGFKLSDYPIIITIELHCSPEGQRVMANLIKTHLGEFLYTGDYSTSKKYPTLNELKRKVIIRSQTPKPKETPESKQKTQKRVDSPDLPNEPAIKNIKEYNDLVNLMQNVSFKGVNYAFENYEPHQTSSLSEGKCDKFLKEETAKSVINYTNNFLVKIYPGFFRTDSSNLNAVAYWNYGFQIAALNFQKNDNPIILNRALFEDNGKCGYVLKPEILRNPSLGFDPLDKNTMPNKKFLQIKVISGIQLPYQANNDIRKDISDPFVAINIYGVNADICEKKTKTMKNNGFNPIWNEDFNFLVNCPELAFVKFSVFDKDVGKDDLIGEYVIKFNNIRQGYRHIKLQNKHTIGTLFVGIRIEDLDKMVEFV